jgi:hypothetical protein
VAGSTTNRPLSGDDNTAVAEASRSTMQMLLLLLRLLPLMQQ